MKTKLPILKTDPDFQSLKPPLRREAYEELELNIVCNGCREPIKVWGDYIIDGHKRYKICHEYEIEFKTEEILLKSREDAISWICADLLHNHELHENYQHYLIGRKYLAEKNCRYYEYHGNEPIYDRIHGTEAAHRENFNKDCQ